MTSAPPRSSSRSPKRPRSESLVEAASNACSEGPRLIVVVVDPRLSHRTKADEKEEDKSKEAAPAEKKEDDEEDEDVTGELAHLDQSNIIQGGRRTRACCFLVLPVTRSLSS